VVRVIEPNATGFRLRVRLTPKGGRDAIDGPGADAAGASFLKARVRAAPEDGKANAALEALLAKALGVPKSAVRVDKGATSRVKLVDVTGGADALDRAKALLGEST
jgi:uncharacterized protein YggU (UPF0235/DUF167 family)